ncbi:hypothetical protein HDV05_008149 [Chytridiales sp. JEL 0842]|nr:hypothetical protein HDV05_008149 [Chytridiales sp. JEL 0842]
MPAPALYQIPSNFDFPAPIPRILPDISFLNATFPDALPRSSIPVAIPTLPLHNFPIEDKSVLSSTNAIPFSISGDQLSMSNATRRLWVDAKQEVESTQESDGTLQRRQTLTCPSGYKFCGSRCIVVVARIDLLTAIAVDISAEPTINVIEHAPTEILIVIPAMCVERTTNATDPAQMETATVATVWYVVLTTNAIDPAARHIAPGRISVEPTIDVTLLAQIEYLIAGVVTYVLRIIDASAHAPTVETFVPPRRRLVDPIANVTTYVQTAEDTAPRASVVPTTNATLPAQTAVTTVDRDSCVNAQCVAPLTEAPGPTGGGGGTPGPVGQLSGGGSGASGTPAGEAVNVGEGEGNEARPTTGNGTMMEGTPEGATNREMPGGGGGAGGVPATNTTEAVIVAEENPPPFIFPPNGVPLLNVDSSKHIDEEPNYREVTNATPLTDTVQLQYNSNEFITSTSPNPHSTSTVLNGSHIPLYAGYDTAISDIQPFQEKAPLFDTPSNYTLDSKTLLPPEAVAENEMHGLVIFPAGPTPEPTGAVPVREWGLEQVQTWMVQNGFAEETVRIVCDRGLTGAQLMKLDIDSLGVEDVDERNKLVKCVHELHHSQSLSLEDGGRMGSSRGGELLPAYE